MSSLSKDDLDKMLKEFNEKTKDFPTFRTDGFGFPMLEFGTRLRIIESPYIPAYAKKEIEVQRTWRERLFSRPWRPLVKTKKIEVDDTSAPIMWRIGMSIYCNPVVSEKAITALIAQS